MDCQLCILDGMYPAQYAMFICNVDGLKMCEYHADQHMNRYGSQHTTTLVNYPNDINSYGWNEEMEGRKRPKKSKKSKKSKKYKKSR